MGKQIFNIKGMMRDLDPAKSPNQYAYEIRNLRLTAQEDTTMLALVTEKGNAQYVILGEKEEPIEILGTVLGYCLLHNYLVLFTHKDGKTPDTIYRLEMNDRIMHAKILYSGNLGFGDGVENIEAIGIYENELLQKVYWIDGVHQPRFINIVANDMTRAGWFDDSFDFVPRLLMNETVEVKKSAYNGLFNAGTIQYVLSYYNKNGQQSAAFYQSPINYISYENKGASPEDTVSNSFLIKITNPNSDHYDYVRIYSVFRSSENGTPVCKKVADIDTTDTVDEITTNIRYANVTVSGLVHIDSDVYPLGTTNTLEVVDNSYRVVDLNKFLWYKVGERTFYMLDSNYSILIIPTGAGSIKRIQAGTDSKMELDFNNGAVSVRKRGANQLNAWASMQGTRVETQNTVPTIEYLDNGISGEIVDYSEILFLGGANIIPQTMAQKNQTLFFGNYSTTSITEEDKTLIKEHTNIYFGYSDTPVYKGPLGTPYMYDNQLKWSAKEITTFKGGETYHFGIILQDINGTWTDVIPIGKYKNIYYPKDNATNKDEFNPVKAYVNFDDTALSIINNYAAVKVVRLNTLPSVVYQGVLCPTVFNNKREDNAPYCQSSWFFREVVNEDKAPAPHRTQNIHNGNIMNGGIYYEDIGEIQGAYPDRLNYYQPSADLVDNDFFVDWNTVTLHSPDIEYSQAANLNYRMRLVGIVPMTAGRTSMSVTHSASYKNRISGFVHIPIQHNNLDTSGYEIDLARYNYEDGNPVTPGDATLYTYPIYPWHRNGSLTAQDAPTGNGDWFALLDTKIMASIRESAYTDYMDGLEYNITKVSIYQEDDIPVRVEEDTNNFLFSGPKTYMGSVDTILTHNGEYPRDRYNGYGKQDNTISILSDNLKEPVRMRYRSTKHGVFSLKSDPKVIYILPNVTTQDTIFAAQAALDQKVPKATVKWNVSSSQISTNQYGIMYLSGVDINVAENGDVVRVTSGGYSGYFYYIKSKISSNKILIDRLDWYWLENHPGGTEDNNTIVSYTNGENSIERKYDFYITNVTNVGIQYYRVPVSEWEGIWYDDTHDPPIEGHYTNEDTEVKSYALYGTIQNENANCIKQHEYDVDSDGYSYMYIAELLTLDDLSPNYQNASWYVASEPYKTGENCIIATIGDTYYQRYDCLKTYPYSPEDQNQIVEIFSFMCETRTNIDGRYDGNRGLLDNTLISRTNFNLLNKAYTQDDNFYTHNYLGSDTLNVTDFPNQIIWTKTKVYGSDIDAWTHIPATSTLDMDGSLGEVRALRLWNDNLICFQDMGIAKIMYNERTTMTTQQGVPVEIANSGKVDGSHYVSNTIGCKNKNSIQVTQEGIYFIDSNKRELYKWSQGFEALSKSKGFNQYFYDNKVDINSIKTFYDSNLKDVYFRIHKQYNNSYKYECLVYNEQLGEFTSFFDYDMDFMFNYKDSLVSIEHNSGNLWKQFAGDEYLRYFGRTDEGEPSYELYSIELISAENPTEDKTFTNIEFRADVLNKSITESRSQDKETLASYRNLASINKVPFKTLRVWDEYQDTGHQDFDRLLRKGTNLSQKFRIWRADIGRDFTDRIHKFNRIRNPWARVQLLGYDENIKVVIHDIAVMYV